ncbi:MAG: hypothetical protein RMK01_05700 [Thermomicrobium sp.]|nr:hypothetical protein [Thermomicrobium sp.]
MTRWFGTFLVGVMLIVACGVRPMTPTDVVVSTPAPTATLEPTPTPLLLPTPSVPLEPFGSCTVERVLETSRLFLNALNSGDLPQLRAALGLRRASDASSRWFAVIPREPDLVATGLFTDRPEGFLDWVARRLERRERWSVLEFVRFSPLGDDRLAVTVALLREADDFIAKPYLARVEMDCRDGVVLSVVAGAVGAQALPGSSRELLAEALGQRSLQVPETNGGACPRSAWAFGDAVGTGPVYLSLGPDAVVNLPDHGTGANGGLAAQVYVSASEHGPILLRLFSLSEATSGPFGEGEGTLFLDPSTRGRRAVSIDLPIARAGCYVLQADGATWQQQVVFEVVAEPLAALVPRAIDAGLPAGLRAVSAWRDGPETIRVGLVGPTLVARLSIAVGGPGEPELGGEQHCEMPAGRIELCWVPHPVWGWPQTAVWDDGMRRYQFVVLAGNRDAWNVEDLRALVRRLSQLEDIGKTSPGGGQ